MKTKKIMSITVIMMLIFTASLLTSCCSMLSKCKLKRAEEEKAAEAKQLQELKTIKIKEYVFGPGDEFNVSVWRQTDLTRDMVINPGGEVSFPYIGTFKAQGLTYSQLVNQFEKRLADYYKSPQVSINVKKAGSQKIYVLGYVKLPGVYNITSDSKLLSILAEAGGFTNEAEKKSVMCIEGNTGKTIAHRIDVTKAINEADMRYNVPVNAGDIIYVPKSFIANVDTFANHANTILTPIVSLERAITLSDSTRDVLFNTHETTTGNNPASSNVITP